MADTFTPLGFTNMETGSHVNTWGDVLDDNFTIIDQSIGGVLFKDVSGNSDVTLSSIQGIENEWRNAVYYFSGLLTGNITVFVPAVPKQMLAVNATTGAFTLTVSTFAGTGQVVAQNTTSSLWCDGTNVNLGLFGFTPPLTITQGGTNATTAPVARANLGIGTAGAFDAGVGDGQIPTGALLKSTERAYSGTQYPATVSVTYQANVTLNLAIHQDATITTNGDMVLSLPANLAAGITGNLEIINGTGTDTLTYGSGWLFVGGLRPNIGQGVGAISVLSWRCTGSAMEAAMNPRFS